MKKIWIFGIIIAMIVLFYALGLNDVLSIESLIEHRDALIERVNDQFLLSILLYIVVYTLIVAFSLPGAAVASLAGGLLFGLIPGVIAANIAATTGASANFILARYVLGQSIQNKYEDRLEKFNKEVNTNGASYLLMLRLIPIMPFFLINLLAGLTTVRFKTFVWTTSLGIIPGTIFYTYAGLTLQKANEIGEILNIKTLSILLFLALIAFLPIVFKKKGSNE